MFRCPVTGKITAPGEPQLKLIVSKRLRDYLTKVDSIGGTRMVRSKGWEIEKEIAVSQEGLDILNFIKGDREVCDDTDVR